MSPAREALGARVALRCATRIGPDPASRDRLHLERDETVDVIVIDLERRWDRETAADRTAGALMRAGAEREPPTRHARRERAVRIEGVRARAEHRLVAVPAREVEHHLRVLWDAPSRDLGVGLSAALRLRRRRAKTQRLLHDPLRVERVRRGAR